MVTDLREIGAFGKELPEQSVRVFVGSLLPGRIRIGEVDLHSRAAS